MSRLVEKNRYQILVAILLLAAFLIFFRLDRVDLRTDDTIYSLRAWGYLDFLDSQLQTTPVMWFETIPWWAKLSFHDAPPLGFILQHWFFKFFGSATLVARLPFALAGLGSVYLLYLIGKKLYGEKVGLTAAFLLTIFTYHTWASRVGYLEPVAIFFSLLAILWFLKSQEQPRSYYLFGIFLGLALLSKYTALFLLPLFLVYLFFKNRRVFYGQQFIGGLILTLVVISPLIIYNLMMWQTRGHFDLQWASLFGQSTGDDWVGIKRGVQSFSGEMIFSVLSNPKDYFSLPVYSLIIISVFYVFYRTGADWLRGKYLLLSLAFIFLIIEFSLLGAEARFVSFFNPFYALALAILVQNLLQPAVVKQNSLIYYSLVSLFLILAGIEIIYNFNTNHSYRTWGEASKHYSAVLRQPNAAFSFLENFLVKETNLAGGQMITVKKKTDLMVDLVADAKDQDVFIYDRNLSWFSSEWYLRRWGIYYRKIVISNADLALLLPQVDIRQYFKEAGAKNLYYIMGRDKSLLDEALTNNPGNQRFSLALAQLFVESGAKKAMVKDRLGVAVFDVYKLKLN